MRGRGFDGWKRALQTAISGTTFRKNQFYFYYTLLGENVTFQISPSPQEFVVLAGMIRNEGTVSSAHLDIDPFAHFLQRMGTPAADRNSVRPDPLAHLCDLKIRPELLKSISLSCRYLTAPPYLYIELLAEDKMGLRGMDGNELQDNVTPVGTAPDDTVRIVSHDRRNL